MAVEINVTQLKEEEPYEMSSKTKWQEKSNFYRFSD